MTAETLLNSPIASVRAFGIIIPAMIDEDPEGAKAALHFAVRLATDLSRWNDYPFNGPDAAFNKLARLVRNRTATSALSHHDVMLLTNACLEAHRIRPFTTLEDKTPEVMCFDTACGLIEDAWRNETETR